jgi:hypothetical protein
MEINNFFREVFIPALLASIGMSLTFHVINILNDSSISVTFISVIFFSLFWVFQGSKYLYRKMPDRINFLEQKNNIFYFHIYQCLKLILLPLLLIISYFSVFDIGFSLLKVFLFSTILLSVIYSACFFTK